MLTFYFQFLCIKSYLGLAQFVLVIRVFEKKRISSRVHIVDHEVLKNPLLILRELKPVKIQMTISFSVVERIPSIQILKDKNKKILKFELWNLKFWIPTKPKETNKQTNLYTPYGSLKNVEIFTLARLYVLVL